MTLLEVISSPDRNTFPFEPAAFIPSMGFLSDGTTLHWDEASKLADLIRKHGIEQLINIWLKQKDRANDVLLWGDEVEYILVGIDTAKHTAKISLSGHEVLANLEKVEGSCALWRPEYGRYMIEGTPIFPYNGECWRDFETVEQNMFTRRASIQQQLPENVKAFTMTNYPLLGSGSFTVEEASVKGEVANSLYTPDDVINPHFRFATLTRNIRLRRGGNVAINMPIFVDKNTIIPSYEKERAEGREALDGHIYMDSMAFGMGQCCIQCTFQAPDIDAARTLYDQFIPLAPIMLALSSATPILRGLLADTDVRWDIIAASVDDRTPQERGLEELTTNKFKINKSRYGSVSRYLVEDKYNDVDVAYDPVSYERLLEAGFDEVLAKHFAHLFIRDPLVIYSDKIELNNELFSDHFENIQSTNWQTVRFKPPPPASPIGWRVEFRPMEAQFTDFENSAFVVFAALLTRLMLSKAINFYMPISQVDENMRRAHLRNSTTEQRFYWRTDIRADPHSEVAIEEWTLDEIMNGKNGQPGLIALVEEEWNSKIPSPESVCFIQTTQVSNYFKLLSQRASGKLQTNAAWIREFVMQHSDYKHDSVVSERINYDLLERIWQIQNKTLTEDFLLDGLYH